MPRLDGPPSLRRRPFRTHAVLTADEEGRIVFWSSSARELFGYEPHEVIGRFVTMLTEGGVDGRVTAVRRDGTRFIADVILEPFDGAGQRLVTTTIYAGDPDVYFAVTDILARSVSLEEAAGPVLETIGRALGWEVAALWLAEGDVVVCRSFWSAFEVPAMCEATLAARFRRGEGLVGRVWDAGRPEMIGDISTDAAFARSHAARQHSLHAAIAFPLFGTSGTIGVLELCAEHHRPAGSVLLDVIAALGAQLGTFIEREAALAAMRRSEEEYRRLVRSFNEAQQFAHVGTFEQDLRDGSIRWSDELYRIFGLAPQSRPIDFDFVLAHIQPEDRDELRAATAEALRTGVPLDLKVGMLRVDGGERVVRIVALPARGEDGQPLRLLGSVLDVTADEIAMREHLELQRELDEAKRMASLGRLAATMAHEFNNVLTGISSFASYLIRRTTDDDTRRAATHIQQALRRGKSITDEILRYTRASEPLLALIDVRGWLESFLPEAMALTGGRVVLQADDGIYIRGDVAQLNQVLANLVLNARDASPGVQPIVIRAMVGADSGTPVPMLDLAVVDQGSGIPPEIRERIFEPLFTTKRSGTGLGLAVVHQVIRAHGGVVRVRSEVGEGTEFHLMLPLTEAPSLQQQLLLDRKVAKMSVLLADDNEAFAAGTIDLMTMEGIRSRVVFRGGDVLAAIEKEVPDALILDVGLPDMRGTDLYPTIARRWPHLPVIFVSGHHREEHVERLLVQPHVAFLEKPFEVEQLLSALARVVTAAA